MAESSATAETGPCHNRKVTRTGRACAEVGGYGPDGFVQPGRRPRVAGTLVSQASLLSMICSTSAARPSAPKTSLIYATIRCHCDPGGSIDISLNRTLVADGHLRFARQMVMIQAWNHTRY